MSSSSLCVVFAAAVVNLVIALACVAETRNAHLTTTFYSRSCPNLLSIVRNVVEKAQKNDVRIYAKLIRLHFHDCFVHGCDGSILLDNADGITSEKNTGPNRSVDGFAVVDDIKTALENVCPGIVSCADILAIASQVSVTMAGGQGWDVEFGRRDSINAHQAGITAIPRASESLSTVTSKFARVGLDSTDLVALSGAHTFGRAHCPSFRTRLYNFSGTEQPDPNLDPTYSTILRQSCTKSGGTKNLADLDPSTPDTFDNNYFTNLRRKRGLLQTDQDLFSRPVGVTAFTVERFASNQSDFFDNFARSMVKMGRISPIIGTSGEVRTNCRRVNK